jgi:hypothetical protein
MFGCAIWGVAIVSVLLVTFNEQLAHTPAEANAFTVLKKLQVRELLKKSACSLLININRKHDGDVVSEFERYKKIKAAIAEFRFLRRNYKDIKSVEVTEKLNFSNLDAQLKDVKDMLVGKVFCYKKQDQNEWYHEMFYEAKEEDLTMESYDVEELGGFSQNVNNNPRDSPSMHHRPPMVKKETSKMHNFGKRRLSLMGG